MVFSWKVGMKRVFFILLSLLWAGNALAKVAEIDTFKLANGLEVAVIENHKAPAVPQALTKPD